MVEMGLCISNEFDYWSEKFAQSGKKLFRKSDHP